MTAESQRCVEIRLDPVYTEGVCADGVAILCDGRAMPIGDILDTLNMAARSDRLEEALHRIVQWADAYPLSVFPEPSALACMLDAQQIAVAVVKQHPGWVLDHWVCGRRKERSA